MADLEKMILAKRENAFGGFLNYMESKYGNMGEDEELVDENLPAKRKKKGLTESQKGKPQKRMKKE